MCTHDGRAADIDLTATAPLRLGIACGQQVWMDNAGGGVTRVRATDLRRLARQVAAARAEHPGRDVIADINVVIADEARCARAALAESTDLSAADTLLYVGTASGLAGLIADMYALRLTDGAMLIPLLGQEMLELIRNEVLPRLQTFLPSHPSNQLRLA